MSEKVDIFMPLFVADYLADTTDLTAEEHGAYLLLLMASWRNGGQLENDPQRLARTAKVAPKRWPAVWEAIARFFDVDSETISQGRLVDELEKARGRKAAASENGKRGAAAKHGNYPPSGKTRSQRLAAARAIATHTDAEWAAIVSEFGGRCVRCGTSGHNPEMDHIIPIYQGGSDGIDNIQPVCPTCNSAKGSESINWAEFRRKHGWGAVGTPGKAPGVAMPERVANSNSSPSPSPSPSQPEEAPPAIPGGAWTGWDWFRRFGSAWSQKYKTLTYGQGDGDSKAIGNLGDILAAMPMDERVAAQLLATEMIAEYLADESPGRVNARHPWKWFVEGFNGFRVPKVKVEPRPIALLSNYCGYHRDARNNNRPSKYPKPDCPECKHCTAANGTRTSNVYVDDDPYVEALRRKHGRLGQDTSADKATTGSADLRDAGRDAGERGAG